MNRVFAIVVCLVVAAAITWIFPLFHIVSRESLRAEREQKIFRAADFVEEFWSTKLMPALVDASEATAVLAALRESSDEARTQFGRTAGLGRSTLYFIRGKGTIVSVDDKQIGVSLSESGTEPDIALSTGLLFGNTVRDATGLLNGDDFPNSQQFNEISAELNRIVETTVLPALKRRAGQGDTIQFVGCAEVTSVPRDIEPLKVVPLEVRFE